MGCVVEETEEDKSTHSRAIQVKVEEQRFERLQAQWEKSLPFWVPGLKKLAGMSRVRGRYLPFDGLKKRENRQDEILQSSSRFSQKSWVKVSEVSLLYMMDLIFLAHQLQLTYFTFLLLAILQTTCLALTMQTLQPCEVVLQLTITLLTGRCIQL